MGKDLNNRELGKGLAQRKDGRYSARFVNKAGRREQAYFDTLREARNWLVDAKYNDEHNTSFLPFDAVADEILKNDCIPTLTKDLTVDQWFEFWIKFIIPGLRSNTLRNYRHCYEYNVKPIMGNMKMADVRPMHCNKVLLNMEEDYAGSTIRQTYIAMGMMFKSAVMNGVIAKHPMDGVRYLQKTKAASDVKFLTLEEQDKFLEAARRSHNFKQYQFVLETGLRVSELIGLTWDSVDFKNKTITIDKQLEYRHDRGTWEAGPPKTNAGYRTLPLTSKAYQILVSLYEGRKYRKEAEELDTQLEFKDRLTGETRILNMKNLVFVSSRYGMPNKNSSYNTHLYKLCEEAEIKHISMHVLRHTYATRAIEKGVNPKALQKLLGHGSYQVTVDTYVHVTDESKLLAVRQFEGLNS